MEKKKDPARSRLLERSCSPEQPTMNPWVQAFARGHTSELARLMEWEGQASLLFHCPAPFVSALRSPMPLPVLAWVASLEGSGAWVDRHAGDGKTALISSLAQGRTGPLVFLLKNGSNPNQPALDEAPLTWFAILLGETGLLDTLLIFGGKLDSASPLQPGPLWRAAFSRNPCMFERVLELGADPWETNGPEQDLGQALYKMGLPSWVVGLEQARRKTQARQRCLAWQSSFPEAGWSVASPRL